MIWPLAWGPGCEKDDGVLGEATCQRVHALHTGRRVTDESEGHASRFLVAKVQDA